MHLQPGDRVGVFEISGALGAGGMGEVYRARDTRLGRDVALKVLPRSVSQDPERLARFEREAQLLARLNHPGIGAIYGVEDSPNGPLLVLELVPGETLEDVLRKGPLPVAQAMSIGRKIADAVAFAHASGVVHRDLKPANIKCAPQGTVKVLDFGVAKALAHESASGAADASTVTGATVDGDMLGTPAYMSPEQARAKDVDRRSDIWSFGCVLFEMLTGQRLFQRQTVTDTLVAILGEDPDWSALPASTPPAIRTLLRRCLQRDRDRRVHDMADVRVELDEALESQTDAAASNTPAQPLRTGGSVVSFELTLAALLVLSGAALIFLRMRLLPPLSASYAMYAIDYSLIPRLYFKVKPWWSVVLPIGVIAALWVVSTIAGRPWHPRTRRTWLTVCTLVMTAAALGGLYLFAGQAVQQVVRLNNAHGTAFVERDIVMLHLAAGNTEAVIALLDSNRSRDSHPNPWSLGGPGEAFHLAEAYARQGDLEAARRIYRRAQESATRVDEVLSEMDQTQRAYWRVAFGLDTEWGVTVQQLRLLPNLVRTVSEQRLKQLSQPQGKTP